MEEVTAVEHVKHERETTDEEIHHSEFGASVIERIWNCRGSRNFIKQCAKAPENAYAEEGKRAHALASETLLGGCRSVECCHSEMLEDVPEKDREEFAEAVNTYVEYCSDLTLANPHAEAFVETKVAIPNEDGDVERSELFGTADYGLHVPFSHLHVVDYKHGAGHKVSVVGNKQLMYYALGMYFRLADWLRVELQRVHLTIVQPRHWSGEPIQTYFVHPDALLKFHKELLQVVKEAKEPDAPLNPGSWCDDTFCPARAFCPALKAKAQEVACQRFAEIELPKEPVAFLRPDELTPEQISIILLNKDLVKTYLNAVEDYALKQASSGVDIPFFKVVEKEGRRRYIDKGAAETELQKHFTEIHEQPKLLSPAQIEKKYGVKGKRVIAPLVEKPITGKDLVPITEKTEKRKTDAVTSFSNAMIGLD